MAHEELDHRLVRRANHRDAKSAGVRGRGIRLRLDARLRPIDGTREDNGLTLRRAMLTGAHEAGDRDSSGDRDS